MTGILPILAVLALGIIIAGSQRRNLRRWEYRAFLLSLAAHTIAAFAQVMLTRYYYGGGDMLGYHQAGVQLANLVRVDPGLFLPRVLALVGHGHPSFPIPVFGLGTPTGAMRGITGLLCLVLDDSIYAVTLLLSLGAGFGKLGIYRVLRRSTAQHYHRALAVASLLMPSVVFWSAGLLKETVAMMGFGLAIWAAHRVVIGESRIAGPIVFCVGAVIVAMVKPYILFALVLSLGVWWYWTRAVKRTRTVRIRPIHLILAGALACVAVVLLGEIFPRYSVDRFQQEVVRLQETGARLGGGSTYELGDQPAQGLLGQLIYAPLGLITALFRPLIIEVHNAAMLVNAVETTLILALFLRVLFTRRWRHLYLQTVRSPILMFSASFVLIFGIAVGLASTNLGTLSRYRIPLVPFFVAILIVWNGAPRGSDSAKTPGPRMRGNSMASRRFQI